MTLDEVRDSLDGDVTIDNSIHTLFILEKQGYDASVSGYA
jgi:hypothetical protein